MRSIGVRELKANASEILRRVREQGEEVEITYHGKAIARLIPVSGAGQDEREFDRVWTDLDRLADEISHRWPAGVSATDAVREGRREF